MRRYSVVIFLLFLLISRSLSAQWQHLAQFDGKRINSLYFLDSESQPSWGVLGLFDTVSRVGSLYYTRDGGKSWSLGTFPFHLKSYNFAFKDSQTGWVGTTLKFPPTSNNNQADNFDSALVLVTHDGGRTWNSIPCSPVWSCDAPSIGGPDFVYYTKKDPSLFITGITQAIIVSNDDGNNFHFPLPANGNPVGGMVAFIDDKFGYIFEGGNYCSTDGGLSWDLIALGKSNDLHAINNAQSFYRAFPVPGTQTFLALTTTTDALIPGIQLHKYEYGVVFRSDDGGAHWNYVGEVPQQLRPVDYLQGDIFRLYAETNDGVWTSTDQGVNWISLCGPSRNSDDSVVNSHHHHGLGSAFDSTIGSPIYVKENRVYVADGTGGLWFLDSADIAPKISYSQFPLLMNASLCKPSDSIIPIYIHNLCGAAKAEIINASLTGSSQFSLAAKSLPNTFQGFDSLSIRYSRTIAGKDTAYLRLHYRSEGKDFDTTIEIFGTAVDVPAEHVQLTLSATPNPGKEGSIISVSIIPDKIVSKKGLINISFDLVYNGDLLDISSFLSSITSSVPGTAITTGAIRRIGSLETLPITITGNDLPLDPSLAVLDLKFQAMVTATASTVIRIDNLRFNGGDPDFRNCVLSADTSSTNFTEIYLCGDILLSTFLRTGSIINITSIHPNPSQDEIDVELQSVTKQDAKIEIFDALGVKVFSDVRNIISGSNSIHCDTKGLAGGMYFVKMGNSSQSFVKVK